MHPSESNKEDQEILKGIESKDVCLTETIKLKLLALRYIDKLLFMLASHPEPLKAYKQSKLMKFKNYGHDIWSNDPKNMDKSLLEA